jgi:two-component system response regulator PilR (NtrC family)
MSKPLCLVVDDEPDIIELLVMTLKPMGINCYTANTLAQAKEHLLSKSFDLCLTDMRLPDGNGIDIVATIGQNYPNTPVAMITAYGEVESAVQALKAGAFDFMSKPIGIAELRHLVHAALQLPQQDKEASTHLDTNTSLPRIRRNEDLLSTKLIGQSKIMEKVRHNIKKLARSQAPIYIQGESGTGKEVVARMIHILGTRAQAPFIPVNCGAIPTELMESEFFGHKKGSFSGAYNDKKGLFQSAQGGTLFLDEIADLPLGMQVKLLRAIQEKRVRAVGASKEEPIDVRILSATHRHLSERVKQGQFREDLFYRLNVIKLYVPPLRERLSDLPDLVATILKNLASKAPSNYQIPKISENAIKALKGYFFPGNVRELENILQRATTLCEDNIIKPEDLQLPDDKSLSLNQRKKNTLDPLLDNVEKENIVNALELTKGNKTKAAQMLGISFNALRYRIRKYHLT